ncbi:C-type lectin domain family 4 member F-like isoform X2 [Puntigrus tetrazona]|uniref:C-type lectin domain family 4 member F-like isoform X2 n=1 Tax=Puntigrus tetrazona TaxID=1606681 RepID=UPI001C899AAD|nr:C-type lectin domain family 4 member F-like isoform X2 [Puntigrus tetrazona]
MDSIYENSSFILSTFTSDEKPSQCKVMVKKIEELTVNYTTVREQLSFYEAQFCKVIFTCQADLAARKIYLFSVDKLNWSRSRDFCVSKGTDLVTITSQSEQDFLFSKIKEMHWIGLNDLETEGHWVWVNNQTLNETGVQFWYKRMNEKSEPDNWKEDDPNGEHCAIIKHFSWYDVSCEHKRNFICEKKY